MCDLSWSISRDDKRRGLEGCQLTTTHRPRSQSNGCCVECLTGGLRARLQWLLLNAAYMARQGAASAAADTCILSRLGLLDSVVTLGSDCPRVIEEGERGRLVGSKRRNPPTLCHLAMEHTTDAWTVKCKFTLYQSLAPGPASGLRDFVVIQGPGG
ncbi:unnamed protein product [Schistocephalus solidus]|uniref:Uncharacterized protein n=1 Tax=Schistocephalus solidus TaxID=70667 RepID=A0A183T9J0_SCHSO|nr:unnamed protein product [Schistocephalus solidus]